MTPRCPPGRDEPLTSLEVQCDPLGFLAGLTADFGDIVRYRVDRWACVLVNRPDYVKHVLQERHRTYEKFGTPDFQMLSPMLGQGLLTTDGDAWYAQRRMAQPAFHRARVEAFGDLIVAETDRTVDRWLRRSAEAFEVADELTQLTTRVVAQALFGADLSAVVDGFGGAVQAMNEFIGHYDPMDRDRYARFHSARTMIHGIVDDIVAERRAGGEDDRGDFLSMLLAARTEDGAPMPLRAVRDQVLTLLMAGHETTAKALTWTLYLLDRHPEAAEMIRAEARAAIGEAAPRVADLPRLGTAWRVLQEAMRLYPPVWVMSRVAAADDVLDGYAIPRGTLVLVSPWALHRHPAHWPAPDRFDPERFSSEADAARHPYAYVPFSGGPRQCIGKHFASLEAHLVLVRLLQRARVQVAAGAVVPEALVTLRPRGGMPVIVHSQEAVRA